MADLIDFDAALAEANGDEEATATFTFRFLGQDWQLPKSPLAKDMLKVRRMYMLVAELNMKMATREVAESDANSVIKLAGGSDLDDLLAFMIGRETVDAWLELGATDAALKKAFRYLWLLYNGQDPNKADDLGEAAPPANRGPARQTRSAASSKTGASSRPTGNGSTAKASRMR